LLQAFCAADPRKINGSVGRVKRLKEQSSIAERESQHETCMVATMTKFDDGKIGSCARRARGSWTFHTHQLRYARAHGSIPQVLAVGETSWYVVPTVASHRCEVVVVSARPTNIQKQKQLKTNKNDVKKAIDLCVSCGHARVGLSPT
jgi:hypothetical protein